MVSITPIQFKTELFTHFECLFENVNNKKRFIDGGLIFYTQIYGRLLDRAIYHNNE